MQKIVIQGDSRNEKQKKYEEEMKRMKRKMDKYKMKAA